MAQSPVGYQAGATTLLNNTSDLALALNAQSAGTVVSQQLYNGKTTLRVNVNIAAITAGSLTVTILGVDPVSNATWTALASAALTTTGLTQLVVGPYIAAVANQRALVEPPVIYQIQAVVATGPVTATISVEGIGQ